MKRNNIFNKIFFPKQIKENQSYLMTLMIKIDKINQYIKLIDEASNLHEIFTLHKDAYKHLQGIPNCGPNPYGYFRTKDIATMTEDEVFLGNINGLWTLPLSKWVNSEDEKVVMDQYMDHLITNLIYMRRIINNEIRELNENGYV